jgi:hypothetical protein
MRALSVRQPFAELILRGVKTIEYRSRPTRIVGERFWIYASKTPAERWTNAAEQPVWSRDLSVPTRALPSWMLELAEQVRLIEPGTLLPTGVIVGSAVIEKVTPPDPSEVSGLFRWHLAGVERADTFRKPAGRPQPVWFNPF